MDKAIFTGFCLLIICFLAVVYYIKPRMDNRDNRVFGKMIITDIVVCTIHMALIFLVRTPYELLINAVLRLYLVSVVAVMLFFVTYVFFLSFPNMEMKWGKPHGYLSFAVFTIVVFILPIYPYTGETLNDVYSYGPAVDFTYIWSGIYQVIAVIISAYGFRKKENRVKLIPMFCYCIMGVVSIMIQRVYPQTILSTPSIVLTTLIMYFTIENPDLRMIEKLKVEKERADRANQAKSDFLASVSHDMKTPLNAIVNFALDAEESYADMPDGLKNNLKNIRVSADILTETVGNILDINKVENGIMGMEEVSYDFTKEVTELAEITSTRIEGKQVTFSKEIARNIPQYLIGDKRKVKSIIVNLLSNAFKYTERGSVVLVIDCECDLDSCMLTITVTDTGRGISQDKLGRLFDKFDRLDTEVETSIEGTGLGLSITKNFVELLGGTIEVTSEVGVGSKFIVKLTQKIDDKVRNAQKSERHSFDKFGAIRLLVVDDNNINRKVVSLQFKNSDVIVEEAANGKECLDRIYAGEQFDAILMDMVMPGMRGDEVMEHLKEVNGFNMPVIALTADITADFDKMTKKGFAGFLTKPLDKDRLWSELDRALRIG